MKRFVFFLICLLPTSAWSGYDANMRGVVKEVLLYTGGGYIYFTLENQPSSHTSCNPGFFVIPDSVPNEIRQMLLSRLLTAYAMKESLNIGYDATGDCTHGYITVHRVG